MVTRAEIEAAKQQVQETEAQIQEARGKVQTSQQQVQAELAKLKPIKRIPFTPRKERLARRKYKQSLGETSGKLKTAAEEISAQESELQKYQTDVLQPADAALRDYELDSAAYEQALAHFNKGHAGDYLYFMKDSDGPEVPYVKKWLKLFIEQQRLGNLYPTETKLGQERLQQAAQAKQQIMQLSKELGIKFQGWEKTANEINKQLSGGYNLYDKPLNAYYDPVTGRMVEQSIAPDIATKMGYLPIQVQGYNPQTGKTLIKSDTGLLTPEQLSIKKFNEAIQKQSTILPTTFEIGGTSTGGEFDITSLTSPTPYEMAARSIPYSETELRKIEYSKLGPEKFYEKYGYEVTSEGEILYGGTVTPVTPEDIATLISGGRALAGIGKATVKGAISKLGTSGGILFSKPISSQASKYVEMAPNLLGFNTEGIPAQVLRGGLYAGTAMIPTIGTAYGAELLKSVSRSPQETWVSLKEYAKERPFEVATMVAIGVYRVREYRLKEKSIRIVKENIRELNTAPIKELTIISKGAGRRINSERVDLIAFQETPKGIRKIQIEGDLLNQNNKIYLIPDATGRATTITAAKPSKLSVPRIYQDVQFFQVGSKSTGIPLGSIGDIQVYTPTGTSGFVPEAQTYALVKKKFGPYAEARTLRSILSELRKDVTYGGTIIKDITLPFQELGFKINEQVSLLLGRKGAGLILTPEPPTKPMGFKGGGKKTPFSETFQELKTEAGQVLPLDTVARNVGRQSRNLVNNLIPVKETSLKGVPRMVGGEGLTEAQLRKARGFSDFLVSYEPQPLARDISSARGIQQISSLLIPVEETKIKIKAQAKTKLKVLEKQKILERQKVLEKQRILEQQKILERQRQLERQRLLEQQRQQQKQKELFETTFGMKFRDFGFDIRSGFKPPRRKESVKKKVKGSKKKKGAYNVLPTLTQQLIGYRGKRPKEYITGFEAIRII